MNSRGPVYVNGVMSPPPSKQASMQSQTSDNNAMFGITSPSQGQLALFHDGFQVGSPQPMPQSPYPQPVHRNTLKEDTELQEFLADKRRRELAIEEQRQQQSLQKQQQQHLDQQQQQDEYQRAQQDKWARFQQWEQQQQRQQQQQQQQSQRPPSDSYPLPPHFGQQSGRGYASTDENDQQHHQQYQHQSAGPQPQMFARRQGNTYGVIKVRGKAKTVIGNVHSGDTPTGFEREHTYKMIDLDEDVDALIGDTPASEMRNFYQRGPPAS